MGPWRSLEQDASGEVWAAAKVLRAEALKVHLALYANRWSEQPDAVQPWALSRRAISFGEPAELDEMAGFSISHVPLSRSAFAAARPRFVVVDTLEQSELDGYRLWRKQNGCTFHSLEPLMHPIVDPEQDGPDA